MLIWLGRNWLDQTEKPAVPDNKEETDIAEEIEDLLSEYDE